MKNQAYRYIDQEESAYRYIDQEESSLQVHRSGRIQPTGTQLRTDPAYRYTESGTDLVCRF